MPPGTRFTMERLVLLVIAVIGLHTAFVLYMADIRRVDPNAETVRNDRPAKTAPERTEARPTLDTDLRASITPPAAQDSPAPLTTRHADRVRPRALRAGSIARSEVRDRRQHHASDSAKPAFALNRSSGTKGLKKSFGDNVVIYAPAVSRPASAATVATASTSGDSYAPKLKKNSLVAKLQFVYKKPWDLIKAVGSKLR